MGYSSGGDYSISGIEKPGDCLRTQLARSLGTGVEGIITSSGGSNRAVSFVFGPPFLHCSSLYC